MGHSFSTCDCIDYDTFEDNIRIRRMENEIKNQRITELSKKDFYSLSDNDEIDDVVLKEPDNVEEIKINIPKSPAIKQIDEIINYLQQIQIPINQELP